MKNKVFFLLLTLIIALIIRIAFLLLVPAPPVVLDANFYNNGALNLLRHGTFSYYYPTPSAVTMPGFPIFLSGIYYIFGESNYTAVRIIQAIMSVLTILFIYLIAEEMFGKYSLSLLSAILAAIYIPFITANALILTEVLSTLVTTIFFYVYILAEKRRENKYYILSGILLGMACLVRPVTLLYPFFVLGLRFLYCLKGFRKEAIITFFKCEVKRYFLLGIFILAVLSPWIIRNYLVFNKAIILSTESGGLLFAGSHINYQFPKNAMYSNEVQQQNHWRREGMRRIINAFGESPFQYAKWYLSKISDLWIIYITVEGMHWRFLKFAFLQHNLMILSYCISVLYILFYGSNLSILLILMYIYHTFFHLPFICIPRYLFVILPIVIISSSHGLYILFFHLREGYVVLAKHSPCKRILLFKAMLAFLLLYLLIILQNNHRQSSGIINLSFHPIMLTKFLGYIIKWAIIPYMLFVIFYFAGLQKIKDSRLLMFWILFSIIFYLGAVWDVGPINLNNTEVAVSFESPLRGNTSAEHIIDLPKWAKGYPDNKLVMGLVNSDENEIGYDMEITVNEKPLLIKKRGDKFLEKEIFINLDPAMIASSEKLTVRINVSAENSQNHPILKGTTHVYRGISLLNGQGENLALPPAKERGTYSIGLRLYGKSRLQNIYYWRGSKRKS